MPKRTDRNQQEIVNHLRYFGATVQDLHLVGHGCPDILVGYGGKNYLFEIKMPGCKQNNLELEFQRRWKGNYYVVTDFFQAVEILLDGMIDN